MYTQGTHLLRRVDVPGIYFDTTDLLTTVLGCSEIGPGETIRNEHNLFENNDDGFLLVAFLTINSCEENLSINYVFWTQICQNCDKVNGR